MPTSIRLLALVFVAFAAIPSHAAAQSKELPPELAVVPQDAFAFIYLRSADLWNGEPLSGLRKLFPREARAFAKELGEDPAETESLIVMYPTQNSLGDLFPDLRNGTGRPTEAMVLIETTVKPFQRDHVRKRVLGKGSVEKKYQGKTYFASNPKGPYLRRAKSISSTTGRTCMPCRTEFCKRCWMQSAGRKRPARSPLPSTWQGKSGSSCWVSMRRTRPSPSLRKQLQNEFLQNEDQPGRDRVTAPLVTLTPLLEIRSAALGLSMGKELHLEGEAAFPTEKQAAEAMGQMEDALVLFRFFMLGQVRAEFRMRIQQMVEDDEDDVGPLVFADDVLLSSKHSILLAKRDVRPLMLADVLVRLAESGLRKATVEAGKGPFRSRPQCGWSQPPWKCGPPTKRTRWSRASSRTGIFAKVPII